MKLLPIVTAVALLCFTATSHASPVAAAACVDQPGDDAMCCATKMNPDPDHDAIPDTHPACPPRRHNPVPPPRPIIVKSPPITNTNTNTNVNANVNTNTAIAASNAAASATGGSANATGGNSTANAAGGAGGSVSLAPGAISGGAAGAGGSGGQGGSVAAGAVNNVNNVYSGGGYTAPIIQAVAPLATGACDGSALSVGLQAQAVVGGFLREGTALGGFASYTTPMHRRPSWCDAPPQIPVAPLPQPITVYVQAPAAPTVSLPPVVVTHETVRYVTPACARMSPARKAVLLSKTNPHGVYRLARSKNATELRAAMNELNASCVDYASAIDG